MPYPTSQQKSLLVTLPLSLSDLERSKKSKLLPVWPVLTS